MTDDAPRPLTYMQWLAWCCYLAGMTQEQIGYSLMIGRETAREHVQHAKRKGWRRSW